MVEDSGGPPMKTQVLRPLQEVQHMADKACQVILVMTLATQLALVMPSVL